MNFPGNKISKPTVDHFMDESLHSKMSSKNGKEIITLENIRAFKELEPFYKIKKAPSASEMEAGHIPISTKLTLSEFGNWYLSVAYALIKHGDLEPFVRLDNPVLIPEVEAVDLYLRRARLEAEGQIDHDLTAEKLRQISINDTNVRMSEVEMLIKSLRDQTSWLGTQLQMQEIMQHSNNKEIEDKATRLQDLELRLQSGIQHLHDTRTPVSAQDPDEPTSDQQENVTPPKEKREEKMSVEQTFLSPISSSDERTVRLINLQTEEIATLKRTIEELKVTQENSYEAANKRKKDLTDCHVTIGSFSAELRNLRDQLVHYEDSRRKNEVERRNIERNLLEDARKTYGEDKQACAIVKDIYKNTLTALTLVLQNHGEGHIQQMKDIMNTSFPGDSMAAPLTNGDLRSVMRNLKKKFEASTVKSTIEFLTSTLKVSMNDQESVEAWISRISILGARMESYIGTTISTKLVMSLILVTNSNVRVDLNQKFLEQLRIEENSSDGSNEKELLANQDLLADKMVKYVGTLCDQTLVTATSSKPKVKVPDTNVIQAQAQANALNKDLQAKSKLANKAFMAQDFVTFAAIMRCYDEERNGVGKCSKGIMCPYAHVNDPLRHGYDREQCPEFFRTGKCALHQNGKCKFKKHIIGVSASHAKAPAKPTPGKVLSVSEVHSDDIDTSGYRAATGFMIKSVSSTSDSSATLLACSDTPYTIWDSGSQIHLAPKCVTLADVRRINHAVQGINGDKVSLREIGFDSNFDLPDVHRASTDSMPHITGISKLNSIDSNGEFGVTIFQHNVGSHIRLGPEQQKILLELLNNSNANGKLIASAQLEDGLYVQRPSVSLNTVKFANNRLAAVSNDAYIQFLLDSGLSRSIILNLAQFPDSGFPTSVSMDYLKKFFVEHPESSEKIMALLHEQPLRAPTGYFGLTRKIPGLIMQIDGFSPDFSKWDQHHHTKVSGHKIKTGQVVPSILQYTDAVLIGDVSTGFLRIVGRQTKKEPHLLVISECQRFIGRWGCLRYICMDDEFVTHQSVHWLACSNIILRQSQPGAMSHRINQGFIEGAVRWVQDNAQHHMNIVARNTDLSEVQKKQFWFHALRLAVICSNLLPCTNNPLITRHEEAYGEPPNLETLILMPLGSTIIVKGLMTTPTGRGFKAFYLGPSVTVPGAVIALNPDSRMIVIKYNFRNTTPRSESDMPPSELIEAILPTPTLDDSSPDLSDLNENWYQHETVQDAQLPEQPEGWIDATNEGVQPIMRSELEDQSHIDETIDDDVDVSEEQIDNEQLPTEDSDQSLRDSFKKLPKATKPEWKSRWEKKMKRPPAVAWPKRYGPLIPRDKSSRIASKALKLTVSEGGEFVQAQHETKPIPPSVPSAKARESLPMWIAARNKEANNMLEAMITLDPDEDGRFRVPEETVVIEMVEKPEYKWREIPESNGVFDWAASVRWVLRGYQDEREDMVTYAETPDRSCLNMLLSYAAAKKLPIRRGDITRAYLNANRKNAILVKTTRSMQKAGLSLYMWAKKNIYGAKDAARVFEEWINELLEELGWNKCNVAQSMYKITGYSSSMLGVRHSDDLAAIGPDAQEVMEALSSKVKMGPITKITEGRFLGCEFMRLDAKTFMSSDTGQLLVKTCDLKLTQLFADTEHVRSLFNPKKLIRNSHLPEMIKKPVEDLSEELAAPCNITQYRSICGVLVFIVTEVRVDVVKAFKICASKSHGPIGRDLLCVCWLVDYLEGTKLAPLVLGGTEIDGTVYHDSAHADADERKSTTFHYFSLSQNSGAIEHHCSTTDVAVVSAYEAETLSASNSVDSVLTAQACAKDLGLNELYENGTKLYGDNLCNIKWMNDEIVPKRARNVAIRHYAVKHRVQDGTIKPSWVKGEDNPADLGTKLLDGPTTRRHSAHIMGHHLLKGSKYPGLFL